MKYLPVTVQFIQWVAKRGQLVQVIKERTFPTETAYSKWFDRQNGNVEVLRFLSDFTQHQETI